MDLKYLTILGKLAFYGVMKKAQSLVREQKQDFFFLFLISKRNIHRKIFILMDKP